MTLYVCLAETVIVKNGNVTYAPALKKAFCQYKEALRFRDECAKQFMEKESAKGRIFAEEPTHDDSARMFIVYNKDKKELYEKVFDITTVPFNGRIELDLTEKRKIVAEVGTDPEYKEIFVGFEEDGVWTQDLAVIGEEYKYADHGEFLGKKITNNKCANIKVYADSHNEDYTNEFIVDVYDEED